MGAVDYPDALVQSRAVSGRGLSKQAWNLITKMREVDALAQAIAKRTHRPVTYRFDFEKLDDLFGNFAVARFLTRGPAEMDE